MTPAGMTPARLDPVGPVPGNRYDLLPEHGEPSVRVVVSDDGSASQPVVPPGVRLVRQEDHGFRAAAARNLGAAGATSDVLVFLDADTVPEPGFVEKLVRRAAASPDVLAVGRRRHADLSGDGRQLPEPQWLVDGYAASRDLLDADGRSFRYVISAVLALRRELFLDLGGFDERFVGYGGEDWDLGYRAWNAGAVLVHERDAVAWHDGPDWAGRPEERAAKEAETARLAAVIPEPLTRGAPLPAELPDVLVDLPMHDPRAVTALLRSSHRDLQVRVPEAGDLHAGAVRTEAWTGDQLARARVRLSLEEPVALAPDVVAYVVHRLTDDAFGEVVLRVDGRRVGTATSTRAAGRARRWAGRADDVVGQCFGREDLEVPVVPPRDDLAGFLAAPW